MERRELDRDLADGDLVQAQIRLYYVIDLLCLDLSVYEDDERLAAHTLQQERSVFQEPVCRSYLQYIHRCIHILRAEFRLQWTRSQKIWTPEMRQLSQQQLRVIAQHIHSDDKYKRMLAVRDLMQRIVDTEGLKHLRQARRKLEQYRSSVRRKHDKYASRQEPVSPERTKPEWEQELEEENNVHWFYAKELDKIRKERGLGKNEKAQLLEKINQQWEQISIEMMHPAQGEEPCEVFQNDDHLPDNVHVLETDARPTLLTG